MNSPDAWQCDLVKGFSTVLWLGWASTKRNCSALEAHWKFRLDGVLTFLLRYQKVSE